MSSTPPPPDTIAQSDFSTCELSDALLKLGVPAAGHIPDLHRVAPHPAHPAPRLCGPAYTVRLVLSSDTDAPRLQGHFVDLAPRGSVAFVSAPPAAQNAVWGGLMTAGAQQRGVLGALVAGRVRDAAEHRAAGFALYARGASTVGQAPYTRAAEVQVPVTVNDAGAAEHGGLPPVTVHPGDVLVADDDGVVCVPAALERDVLRLAARGRAVDARCLADIQAGVGVAESFRRHRGK
ncbi:ribonuclease E inhibitor RraA/Dimethylmenaquinone methyltransferase [Gloeopeniophorella convolvens]|nr:ribonuclease E inhibitor RraA/Dimethylmenaquinone methyltransferase [Gloeopeniophorella convolvens]